MLVWYVNVLVWQLDVLVCQVDVLVSKFSPSKSHIQNGNEFRKSVDPSSSVATCTGTEVPLQCSLTGS